LIQRELPYDAARDLAPLTLAFRANFTAFSWNSVVGLLKAGKLCPLAVAANTRD